MDKKSLLSFVEKFNNQTVFVVGDIGLDRYTEGDVERISPEAPVPIVRSKNVWNKLGLAGNVADNIASLGGDVCLFSIVGMDQEGYAIGDMVPTIGIRPRITFDGDRPTTLKHRFISGSHHFLRVDRETTLPISTDSSFEIMQDIETELNLLNRKPVVIIQDYGKGVITSSLYNWISAKCREEKICLLVDPCNKRPAVFYSNATFLTPNVKEAESMSGIKITSDDLAFQAGKAICEHSGSVYCAMTRSEKGISLIDRAGSLNIPTFAKAVFDVSGAGDTVIATMALAVGVGATPHQACVLGNYAAGIVVGKIGTANVSKEELVGAILK